jgi:hypothetical protein
VPPTPTVAPTATPAETASGTLLENGQTWKQANWSLLLTAADPASEGLPFMLQLTNYAAQTRIISYSQSNFSAFINGSAKVPVTFNPNGFGGQFDETFGGQLSVKTNEQVLIPDHASIPSDERGFRTSLFIRGKLSTGSISSIDIVVSGISSISDAHWKIPINH